MSVKSYNVGNKNVRLKTFETVLAILQDVETGSDLFGFRKFGCFKNRIMRVTYGFRGFDFLRVFRGIRGSG